MTTETMGQPTTFGRHMKRWRRQSGLSQLELSVRTGMSQRHVSFIETGRSRPGEDVVHRIAEALQVPLRDRNALLEAAGLPPSYPEVLLSDAVAAPYRDVIQKMLDSHEPYPAYVINHWWEMIDSNAAGRRMFPVVGDQPVDLVDTFLGPGPIRDMVDNFSTVAWTFLRRLRREVGDSGPDERLDELLERAEAHVKDVPVASDDWNEDLVVCPNYRIGDEVIKTVSMVARFGTARDVTLDELRVELVFPEDDQAEAFFRRTAEAAS